MLFKCVSVNNLEIQGNLMMPVILVDTLRTNCTFVQNALHGTILHMVQLQGPGFQEVK